MQIEGHVMDFKSLLLSLAFLVTIAACTDPEESKPIREYLLPYNFTSFNNSSGKQREETSVQNEEETNDEVAGR